MTEQELRKLGRRELMDLLLSKNEETDSAQESYVKLESGLQDQISRLQEQIRQLQAKEDHYKGKLAAAQEQNNQLRAQMSALQSQNRSLETQLRQTEEDIDVIRQEAKQNTLQIDNAGSIAEAALQINHVFEDAEKAAAMYLENIKSLSERQDAVCAQREQDSKEKAIRLLQKTEERCREKVAQTRTRCTQMEENARTSSEAYWTKLERQMKLFVNSHDELKDLMGGLEQGITKAKNKSFEES